MNLSDHFTREELEFSATAIRYGIDNSIPEPMLDTWRESLEQIVEPIRKAAVVPLHVESGYRCEQLNRMIGGSLTSQHRGFYVHLGISYAACAFDLIPLRNFQQDGMDKFALFRIIQNAVELRALPVDQLIYELGNREEPAWVHVSYVIGLPPRFDVLRAELTNGKVIYTPYEEVA